MPLSNVSKKKSSSRRYRNFVSLLYPESCNPNWKDIITSLGIPCVVSPLHDKDLNKEVVTEVVQIAEISDPDDSGPKDANVSLWADVTKKAHYHIMLCFDGVKTLAQAQEIFNMIGAIRCIPVDSIRGMARYFCHLDNPEKYQYSPSEVITFGGVDYDSLVSLPSDDIQVVIDMMHFIFKHEIFSFRLFADICARDYPDWFTVLFRRTTYYIKEYIKSFQWEMEHPNHLIHGITSEKDYNDFVPASLKE